MIPKMECVLEKNWGFSEKSLYGCHGLVVPCVLYSREYSMHPPGGYTVVLI